jgi:hypothetical protein
MNRKAPASAGAFSVSGLRLCGAAVGRQADREAGADLGGGLRRDMAGRRGGEQRAGALAGAFQQIPVRGVLPFLRRAAVGHRRVVIVGLHAAQGLAVAEEMAGAADADLADGVEREGLAADFEAAGGAQHRADQVIVQNEAFERAA